VKRLRGVIKHQPMRRGGPSGWGGVGKRQGMLTSHAEKKGSPFSFNLWWGGGKNIEDARPACKNKVFLAKRGHDAEPPTTGGGGKNRGNIR